MTKENITTGLNITRERMIQLLNEDLAGEYQAIIAYTVYSQVVKGTPLDFTHPVAIGAHILEMKGDPGGYDHNFVLSADRGKFKLAASVVDAASGRKMEVWTTEPGVQFYSGNFLDGTLTGKRGIVYGKHSGFCLETQHFPDAVNQPAFPPVILRPPSVYSTQTTYKFSTVDRSGSDR